MAIDMDYEITYVQRQLSSVWPNWRISKKLGKGSYGSVYEIIRDDLGTKYTCALKVLHMEAENSGYEDTEYMPSPGTISVDQMQNPQDLQAPGRASHRHSSLQPAADFDSSSSQAYSQASSQAYSQASSQAYSQASSQASAQARIVQKTVWNSSSSSTGSQSPPPGLLLDGISGQDIDDFVRSVSSEIDLMMQLKAVPNIVTIEDYAILRKDSRCTFLIRMEELEPLESYLRRRGGALSKDELIRLGTDICSALNACEQRNILHRDIKTSNLFYSEEAGFKLGDFGISRTMASIREKSSMSGIGTLRYMAPEIYQGKRYNNTADIYSLGIVLYVLCNGLLPPLYDDGSGRTPSALSAPHLHEANMRRLRGEGLPPPRYADEMLSSVICTACHPIPEHRFQTSEAFRRALLATLQPGLGSYGAPPRQNENISPRMAPVNNYNSRNPANSAASAGYANSAAAAGYVNSAASAGYANSAASARSAVPADSATPVRYAASARYTTPVSPARHAKPAKKAFDKTIPLLCVLFAAVAVLFILLVRLIIGVANPASSKTDTVSSANTPEAVAGAESGQETGGSETLSAENTETSAENENTAGSDNNTGSNNTGSGSGSNGSGSGSGGNTGSGSNGTGGSGSSGSSGNGYNGSGSGSLYNDDSYDSEDSYDSSGDDTHDSEGSSGDDDYDSEGSSDGGYDSNASGGSGGGVFSPFEKDDSPNTNSDDDPIEWTDTNLKDAVVPQVQSELGITGEITIADARKVQKLNLEDAGITDISSLAYFIGLNELNLCNNFISDISPLSEMIKLEDLDLEKNQISDLSALSELTRIKELDLYQNNIDDISALADLTEITMLDIRENKISDISALQDMGQMKDLYMSTNRELSDLSPLSGMSSLHYLSVKETSVSDISLLRNATDLGTLVISWTDVTNISVIDRFPDLSYLDIRGCDISDLGPANRAKQNGTHVER